MELLLQLKKHKGMLKKVKEENNLPGLLKIRYCQQLKIGCFLHQLSIGELSSPCLKNNDSIQIKDKQE